MTIIWLLVALLALVFTAGFLYDLGQAVLACAEALNRIADLTEHYTCPVPVTSDEEVKKARETLKGWRPTIYPRGEDDK